MSSVSDHLLFLQADGTVKSCGDNRSGQCGTGNTTSPKVNLTTIPNLTNVKQASAGLHHSLFLLNDGTVKVCGKNFAGECGTGDSGNYKLNLTLIPGLTDVAQVFAGEYVSLFLLNDGTVKFCGINSNYQSGQSGSSIQTPSIISNLADVVQMSTGGGHCLFLLKDGTVKSCGDDYYKQCGQGSTPSNKTVLAAIPGLTDVVQIETGEYYSLFLLKDGTVKSCGDNRSGQCGTGNTTSPKVNLTTIPNLTNVVQMSTGGHSLFLLKDGTVKSCGMNYSGQCGTGNKTSPKVNLTTIPNLTNVKQVKSILSSSFFLLKDDTIKFCGYNGNGESGTGNTTTPITIITTIPDLGITSFQDAMLFDSWLTEAELAIIDLNNGIVTTTKVNKVIDLLNVAAPNKYHTRSQKAVAEHMPKKSDADFTDYTPGNFQARLDAATEKAEKKHKEMKSFYNFLSKLPSMKI